MLTHFSKEFASKYTIGLQIAKDGWHASTIQNQLTRSLSTKLVDVCDEIDKAFQEYIPQSENNDGKPHMIPAVPMSHDVHSGWVAVPALRAIQQVVCRASNRIFVGLPLCESMHIAQFTPSDILL